MELLSLTSLLGGLENVFTSTVCRSINDSCNPAPWSGACFEICLAT